VLDEDAALGLELARRHVALRIPFMRSFALGAGVEPGELELIGGRLRSSGLEAAAGAVSESTAHAFCAIGGVDALVQGAQALAAAGVSQISFGGPFGSDVEAVIRRLGEQVLPKLRD
jgi:5,10-methylenetetrahydromethanopterin reductase